MACAKCEAMKKSLRKKADKKEDQIYREGKKADKIGQVMEEFKDKKLRSGSKKGPRVKSKRQALAIALSEARAGVKKKKKK